MLSICDGEALDRALRSDLNDEIRNLLRVRRRQLEEDQPDETIADLAHFAIVEPGDTLTDLEKAIGFSILQNPVDGSRLGEAAFTPGFEWIENHGWGWEMVWIMSDCGFGYVVIIPDEDGVAPQFLSFCRQYSSEHA